MALRLLDNTSPPLQDKVTQPGGMLTEVWSRWFGRLPATLNAIPSILNVVELSAQGTSISPTDFAGTILLQGLYRVSYIARISRAATVSSSLTVTLAWTTSAVAMSYVGGAIIGNTTTSYQSVTLLIRSDASLPVTFSTTYASAGGTSMQYDLDVVIERIKV